MAIVPNNCNRNRTISFRHSPVLKARPDKPVSSSCSNTTRTSSLRQEFHASCKGFLRFKLWVRASVSLKKKAARCLRDDHKDSQSQQVVQDDDRNEEHSSSTNWGFKNGNNFLVSSIDKKKLVEISVYGEPFLPLKEEEVAQVKSAFSRSNGMKILVSHKKSNIDISGDTLQCLMPNQWLNDEVINLYLELLKERETRDPQKYFFKCHFFNTFFYIKLVSGSGYNYKAVSKWTTKRKLGYALIDCDIIFVPIHIGIHWSLAVINNRERKFLYFDSLVSEVDRTILNALAKYLVDEAKEKSKKNIDVSSWNMEYVKECPQQLNGDDCGMFMLKYIDFYSRGLSLQFSQKDMPYFRLRTANEILRLRAD
ncbi:Papain-like cysteine peptidase superfamily [Arabidopsis suecica]|uniref:Papain-like cysteine peptidase superfamily n=1 Tax=Arabidopsis suecica TaxID=45249 RepID=A0A8T1YRU3_ARASU|nr:Papain-like cysteine peptidase superfamily [Arabidopsis suecica]